jgi:hypothetical protein
MMMDDALVPFVDIDHHHIEQCTEGEMGKVRETAMEGAFGYDEQTGLFLMNAGCGKAAEVIGQGIGKRDYRVVAFLQEGAALVDRLSSGLARLVEDKRRAQGR